MIAPTPVDRRHRGSSRDPLQYDDLKDFITYYDPDDRNKRKATWSEKTLTGRWRKYTYDEVVTRDKASRNIQDDS